METKHCMDHSSEPCNCALPLLCLSIASPFFSTISLLILKDRPKMWALFPKDGGDLERCEAVATGLRTVPLAAQASGVNPSSVPHWEHAQDLFNTFLL